MDKYLLIKKITQHQIRKDLHNVKVGENIEVITKVLDKKNSQR